MWAGPLHSTAFVERFLSILPPPDGPIYGTVPRIIGMLQTAHQEIPLEDSPFFHIPSRLSKIVHCEAPPNAALRGALVGLGYKVARSHCKPNSIKTNAPHDVVWDVMKRWIEQKPRKDDAVKSGTPGFKILQKPKDESRTVVFDKGLGKEEDKAIGVVRYQVNPTANWGPMARAGGSANQSAPNFGESDQTSSENKKRVRRKTFTDVIGKPADTS
jgi:tRNA (guanine26-N2/guanine27-N2)-dimethyltransferase